MVAGFSAFIYLGIYYYVPIIYDLLLLFIIYYVHVLRLMECSSSKKFSFMSISTSTLPYGRNQVKVRTIVP